MQSGSLRCGLGGALQAATGMACSPTHTQCRTKHTKQASILTPTLLGRPVQNFNWTWSRQQFTGFPPASLPLNEAAGTTTHFTATASRTAHCAGCALK